jgi:hypothetical protein
LRVAITAVILSDQYVNGRRQRSTIPDELSSLAGHANPTLDGERRTDIGTGQRGAVTGR